jgi:hypothetical protein
METIYLNINIKSLAEIALGNNFERLKNVINGTRGERYFKKEYINPLLNDLQYTDLKNLYFKHKIRNITEILIPLSIIYLIKFNKEEPASCGHDLSDLFFEKIIMKDDNTIIIDIGS